MADELKEDPKNERVKTSINVDPELWREFGARLTRMGGTYQDGLDLLIREFLAGRLGKEHRGPVPPGDPLITPQDPVQRDIVQGALAAVRDPRPDIADLMLKGLRGFLVDYLPRHGRGPKSPGGGGGSQEDTSSRVKKSASR